MEFRFLGNSGLKISEIAYGNWVTHGSQVEADAAKVCVNAALDAGLDLVLTPEHDGLLVADVVAEWASRHGQPYSLQLTGPAGGTWSSGDGGPELELDAVEFCRIVSGRATGTGLLAQQVPF